MSINLASELLPPLDIGNKNAESIANEYGSFIKKHAAIPTCKLTVEWQGADNDGY